MVLWLSSWPAEVWCSIPGLTATISKIGYLQLPSCDVPEISLNGHKSSK